MTSTYRDDAPGPGSTVWYATGAGWRADGGTLDPAWKAGDPNGRGTPSTATEEQVWVSPPSSKNKKNDSALTVTVSPADIPAYRLAVTPLYAAQSARQQALATPVATARPERPTFRMHHLAERISWLEWALANPPRDGMAYQVMVGPWQEIGVHIPVEVVQSSIRVALTDMRRERERGLQRGH